MDSGVYIKQVDDYVYVYEKEELIARAKYPVLPGDTITVLNKDKYNEDVESMVEIISNYE